MFMLFLQSLLWLLLATLLGALLGWFIRPFFCRDCDREMAAQGKAGLRSSNDGSAHGGINVSGKLSGASGDFAAKAADKMADLKTMGGNLAAKAADKAADLKVAGGDLAAKAADKAADLKASGGGGLTAKVAGLATAGVAAAGAGIQSVKDMAGSRGDTDVDIDANANRGTGSRLGTETDMKLRGNLDAGADRSVGGDLDASANIDGVGASIDTDTDADIAVGSGSGISGDASVNMQASGNLNTSTETGMAGSSNAGIQANGGGTHADLSADGAADTSSSGSAGTTAALVGAAGAGTAVGGQSGSDATGSGQNQGSSGSHQTAGAGSHDNNDDDGITDAMRPAGYAAPQGGKADDLKKIKGIGPVIEKTLNTEGIYHYQQIADFNDDNVRWVNKEMSFPGRIEREDWIGQAKALAGGQAYEGYAYDPDTVQITEDMRPQGLAAPEHGQADDLQRIKGIGPVIEKTLNEDGVYHYRQIAEFTPRNTMWVDKEIAFPGRVHREDWIGQAKALMNDQEYSGYGLQNAGDGDDDADQVDDSMRPPRAELSASAKGDDLKVINGIGPVIEETLNDEGIHYYQQIADFDDGNVRWVNKAMSFPGRIEREDWIGQAKILVGQQQADNGTNTVSDDMQPELLSQPLGGKADDLKRIKGVGLVLEKTLQELGIYHYHQIAELTPDNVKWVDHHIAFPGRIERENWISQAQALALGKTTEYSDRFDDGETPYKD